MKLTMDILFFVVISGTIMGIFFIIQRTYFYLSDSSKLIYKMRKKTERLLQMFLLEENNNEAGEDFVRLIKSGFFATIKSNNHSKNFNDARHLEDFKKSLTPEIKSTLKEIGKTYERYYI